MRKFLYALEMTDHQKLAAAIPPLLEKLYTSTAALRCSLEQLQESPRPWQSYLLQPPFARDAAAQLDMTFDRPFALTGALFAQLNYCDTAGDARSTLQIPGLLAVPESTIALARQLNTDKAAFAQAVSDFKSALKDRTAPERDLSVRELLSAAGYPRAHLRQCYRQILLCPKRPDAIALSWIKARKSIRKVTVQWCERKLVQLDPQGADPGIQYQRHLLAELPNSRHDDLRQVQVQSRPNLQVAEIFRDDQGETYRQVGYSAMPVLVPADERGQLPDFTRVDHQPGPGRRRQRRDLALPTEPLLPALRVFLRQSDSK
ncbi:DNA replication terminus site binding protein [Microbulbifer thermotolerans]|uniref:hypothetical protein n=1 Tax=Microbulbifer thermotolerans TaxID=252514 RepID=UPI0008E69BC0|nr:hypothetical protein [Microbulbifer thermotolerans]MCX2836266.1 hypothetical protein [Microbulbifer thermotolerans]MCX2840282.1 hypothetical protein [Microbulbifer thermotolerans]SFB90754.1 DNA replication terminus site binding protein [Microbulbifer thermotolerans]